MDIQEQAKQTIRDRWKDLKPSQRTVVNTVLNFGPVTQKDLQRELRCAERTPRKLVRELRLLGIPIISNDSDVAQKYRGYRIARTRKEIEDLIEDFKDDVRATCASRMTTIKALNEMAGGDLNIRIEFEEPEVVIKIRNGDRFYWITDGDGDPPRTLRRSSAKRFPNARRASGYMREIIKRNPHRNFDGRVIYEEVTNAKD